MGSPVHGEEVTLQTPEAASFRPRAHQVRPLHLEENRVPGLAGDEKGEVHVTAAACSQTQAVDKVPTSAEVYFFLIPSPRSACLKPVGPPLLPGTFWSWGIFFLCFFPVSRSKGLENLKETSKFHPLISSLSLWSTQNSSYICFFLDWAFPELSDRPQNLSLHTSH